LQRAQREKERKARENAEKERKAKEKADKERKAKENRERVARSIGEAARGLIRTVGGIMAGKAADATITDFLKFSRGGVSTGGAIAGRPNLVADGWLATGTRCLFGRITPVLDETSTTTTRSPDPDPVWTVGVHGKSTLSESGFSSPSMSHSLRLGDATTLRWAGGASGLCQYAQTVQVTVGQSVLCVSAGSRGYDQTVIRMTAGSIFIQDEWDDGGTWTKVSQDTANGFEAEFHPLRTSAAVGAVAAVVVLTPIDDGVALVGAAAWLQRAIPKVVDWAQSWVPVAWRGLTAN
ncbi:MAG: hypothetical protein JXA57_18715, partial [Armatimonadetes bacterium]|nr:hypothetical protein [Armatimonadota bacterium]